MSDFKDSCLHSFAIVAIATVYRLKTVKKVVLFLVTKMWLFLKIRYGTAQRQRRKRTQLFAIYERVSSVTSAF